MNERRRSAVALAAALALSAFAQAAALAQSHGGQGAPAHSAAPPPPPRQAAPPPRQAAPPPASRPAAPPAHGENGFSFPHDVNAPPLPPPKPVTRTVPAPNGANHPPLHLQQVQFDSHGTGGPYHGTFHGPVISNPHHWGGWGWNHGVVWYPSPIYWGGGFWGPFALGAFTSAVFFGSIIDYQQQVIYPSYQAVESSPGAQLLQNYGLQQTECGPPDLVVIWGPGNSVICAYPNNLVAPGNYELDPATLSIVSR